MFSSFHFRRHRNRTGKLHPAAIVAITLAAAILLTVLVGNLLYYWLDDETFRQLTEGEAETAPPSPIVSVPARKVNAYPFTLGDDLGEVLGTPALSVAINTPDGRVTYTSAVTAYLGLPSTPDVPLTETMAELCSYIPFASGVFYTQAFSQADPDLFYTAALSDAALLREFANAGADELLLCSLPLDETELDRVMLYLRAIKANLPKIAVGVAVPPEVARAEGSWEILSTLLTVCDFCGLDLSREQISDEGETGGDLSPSAAALLADVSFYLNAYGMRVLIADGQTALLTTLEMQMYPNYQVIPPIKAH